MSDSAVSFHNILICASMIEVWSLVINDQYVLPNQNHEPESIRFPSIYIFHGRRIYNDCAQVHERNKRALLLLLLLRSYGWRRFRKCLKLKWQPLTVVRMFHGVPLVLFRGIPLCYFTGSLCAISRGPSYADSRGSYVLFHGSICAISRCLSVLFRGVPLCYFTGPFHGAPLYYFTGSPCASMVMPLYDHIYGAYSLLSCIVIEYIIYAIKICKTEFLKSKSSR